MQYYQARPHISSGDVIGIATRGPLSPFIRFVQWLAGFGAMSDMAHVGVAKWIDERIFLVEMDGVRNVLCPLSQYAGLKMYVYKCPVPVSAMDRLFDAVLGRFIPYGYFDLIAIGLRMVFRIKGKTSATANADMESMVCSHFALLWLTLSGWCPPPSMPAKPSPCELCGALEPKFVINEGVNK
jgi:hypothetical protein